MFNGPRFKGQGAFLISELDVVAAAAAAEAPAIEEGAPADVQASEQPATALEVGQTVKIKATATNRKWRGREGVLLSRKTKDPTDTDPMWMVRQGVPPKHADCSFFASDLELVEGGAA